MTSKGKEQLEGSDSFSSTRGISSEAGREAGTRFSVGWYKVLSSFCFSRLISGVKKGDIKICEVCLYMCKKM